MTFIDFGMLSSSIDEAWLPALDALLKVTLVLAASGAATFALGRASAAVRHMIWTVALTSALFLPLLSIALPRWQLPLVTIAASPEAPTPAAPAIGGTLLDEIAIEEPRAARRTPAVVEPTSASEAAAIVSSPVPATSATRLTLPALLVVIWAAGVVAVIARMLLGLVAVHWMSRRSARVVDAPWLPLAIELGKELGITQRLTFLESRTATMPMAFGIVRPVVVMPADAVQWPTERLRIVLLHELAHVKRRDCLTHLVAQLACAVHWFNPLAWIAARHVRTERERACDDLVLASGTQGPDYAEELLEIARVMRAERFPALLTGATLAMAHRSQLEGRLIAILDPKVPRSSVSRTGTVLAVIAATCALPPIASLQPWTVAQAAPAGLTEVEGAAAVLPESTQTPTPAPKPEAAPAPTPAQPASAERQSLSQAIADAVAASTSNGAIEGITQAAIAGALQSATQGSMNMVVQDAIQGALAGAAEVVGQEGKRASLDPRTIAALTAALKDTDKEVRETAMHALIQLRDPAIFEPLVQALKDAAQDVREQAAIGLGQIRDKRAVDPLIGALKDQNPGVREAVVRALGQLRDPRAVDGIVLALKDDNPGVREQAAFALGQLRDARAVDGLIAALTDTHPDVREQGAFALGQLRDKRAAPALNALIKDSDADVREQAVFALGQLRDVAAIEGLVAALRDAKPDVREQAAFALGQIRDARAVAPLVGALKDEHADVREQAAFSLGQIRDRSAVDALVAALKDSAPNVREQAAFALGQLRDPRALDALMAALKDSSADVRQQAAFALGQLVR
jgi:HEAT repeat protein/beta-lactamase regulating signal transducer with metallopeptidase domain